MVKHTQTTSWTFLIYHTSHNVCFMIYLVILSVFLSKDVHVLFYHTHHRKSELFNGERDFSLSSLILALFVFEWSLNVCLATTSFRHLTSRKFYEYFRCIFDNRDSFKPSCMPNITVFKKRKRKKKSTRMLPFGLNHLSQYYVSVKINFLTFGRCFRSTRKVKILPKNDILQ